MDDQGPSGPFLLRVLTRRVEPCTINPYATEPMARSTQRTPEELAAFKAANLAAPIKTTIIEPRKSDRRFTITWMTPAGNFGWTTVRADSIEEAAEAWFTLRGRSRIPATAEIELIKRGGQEV